MNILGIDPGISGALVASLDGKLVLQTMPSDKVGSKSELDMSAIIDFITSMEPDHVFLEKSQSMPGQGVASMFSIGKGYGILMGILGTLALPYTLVHPKTWQSVMFRDLPKDDTKKLSLIVCKRLWPKQSWLATTRCSKPHDGLTDAALIAEYGRRSLSGTLELKKESRKRTTPLAESRSQQPTAQGKSWKPMRLVIRPRACPSKKSLF